MFSAMPSGITGGGTGTLGVGAGMLLSGLIGTVGQGISNWITRKREDTAVQRRAADMEAAGINPTLAAGSPAQAQPLPGALSDGAEKAALALSMMKMKSDISLSQAQARNVDADTTSKTIANRYSSGTLEDRTIQAKALAAMDNNKMIAEQTIRNYVSAGGDKFSGNTADLRARAEGYEMLFKSANANRQAFLSDLEAEALSFVQSGGVRNPLISEYLSKAIAAAIYQKENDWFERKAWLQAGGSAVGMSKDIFMGLHGLKK